MKIQLSLLALILSIGVSYSQNDSIFFKNGDKMIGEVKSLNRGVMTFKTDYSNSNFKIDWEDVDRIFTGSYFLILLSNSETLYGKLESVAKTTVNIISEEGNNRSFFLDQIVMLDPIDRKFVDRFSASIDLGFSITKANDLRQFTSRSMIGYKQEKYNAEANFNTLQSIQSNADTVKRTEGGILFRYLIGKKWFVTISASVLSNTEQKIDWRSNSRLGIGRYLLHTNRSHWGIRIGFNRNLERFSNETPDRNSWEGNFGTELDLFNIGDFSLLNNIVAYPSITEKGRWRIDGELDIRYDLPLDFYIKGGVSLNYDSQPAEGAGNVDYVLQTGFGWEW